MFLQYIYLAVDDSMASSVEDYLIEGLSFKLNPGASYVTDRRSVSYITAGSNIYQSGSGARVIRINLTGEGWLDPSTVRLSYTRVNNDGTANRVLRPLSGPWSFFRRARCLVGGATRAWMMSIVITGCARCFTS